MKNIDEILDEVLPVLDPLRLDTTLSGSLAEVVQAAQRDGWNSLIDILERSELDSVSMELIINLRK